MMAHAWYVINTEGVGLLNTVVLLTRRNIENADNAVPNPYAYENPYSALMYPKEVPTILHKNSGENIDNDPTSCDTIIGSTLLDDDVIILSLRVV